MEQNRFRHDPPVASGDSAPLHDFGDVLEQFTQLVHGKSVAVRLEDHKTEMKVTLPQQHSNRGKPATFNVTWHLLRSHLMATVWTEKGSLYQIAQWYPRMNVYDDVKGWNTEPYVGTEFFLEYGDFTMQVTVPSNYIVAATGTLDNPAGVLTATEIARLNQAATSDTVHPRHHPLTS